jgi:hypothetical protein
MHQNKPSDAEVAGWLKALGIESLCQWDVLVFLYRHQITLVSADYLARLLGYAPDPVMIALDVLESLGFVERSRVSQGARLYQFTMPPVPPRGEAFQRLLTVADSRTSRLVVSEQFRRSNPTPQGSLAAVRRSRDRVAQQRPQPSKGGREPWLKAI